MRKIGFIFLFFIAFGWVFMDKAMAAEVCTEWGTPYCVMWVPDSSCTSTDINGNCLVKTTTNICIQYATPCTEYGGVAICYSNQYACSRGCCDVGTVDTGSTGGACTYTCRSDCGDSTIGCGDCCGTCAEGLSCCGDLSACYVCTASAPSAPTAVSPLTADNYTEKTARPKLVWTAVTNWGKECSGTRDRLYDVCVGPDATNICGGQEIIVPNATSESVLVSGLTSAINYWKVRAINAANKPSAWTATNSFCFAGDDSENPRSVTAWSVCDPITHIRTRQCVAGCDCAGVRMSETCEAYVQGTIFDASFLTACPADVNGDGYADESLTPDQYARNESFSISDEDNSPPAGTPSGTFIVKTAQNGNYQARVYAGGDASASGLPVRYAYDFSGMANDFDLASGPKLLCNNTSEAVASVWSNDQLCLYQPCTVVGNQNFGFSRIFGGWWQVTGGSVYGAGGVRSYIPPSTSTYTVPQQLILADSSDRVGLLAYGVKNDDQLGYNPNARVSSKLWEIQNLYQGLRYDYNYYNARMGAFSTTAWDGTDINYDDVGIGYQIFKHTGDVTLTGLSLSGTQKVILLVNGNVTAVGDLVVPKGGFLGIIAKGDITFNSGVAKAQGWFVAENINVPCHDEVAPFGTCDRDDVQFEGAGSFVAWTNINLRRDRFKTNNVEPSEVFTYRPDMFTSVPAPMKVYTKKFTPFVP